GTVRLTEGEIKADVATSLSGMLTVSAPGVSNWRGCLPALQELKPKTVRGAFGSHASVNAPVALAPLDCCEGPGQGAFAVRGERRARAGLAVEVERWPWSKAKGIDDALRAGVEVEVLAGDAVAAYLDTLAPHDLPRRGPEANGRANGRASGNGVGNGVIAAPA